MNKCLMCLVSYSQQHAARVTADREWIGNTIFLLPFHRNMVLIFLRAPPTANQCSISLSYKSEPAYYRAYFEALRMERRVDGKLTSFILRLYRRHFALRLGVVRWVRVCVFVIHPSLRSDIDSRLGLWAEHIFDNERNAKFQIQYLAFHLTEIISILSFVRIRPAEFAIQDL